MSEYGLWDDPQGERRQLKERIAELEKKAREKASGQDGLGVLRTEISSLKWANDMLAHDKWNFKARAEKAEAEVERLKKARCDHCGETWYEFDEFEKEGGGRESGPCCCGKPENAGHHSPNRCTWDVLNVSARKERDG